MDTPILNGIRKIAGYPDAEEDSGIYTHAYLPGKNDPDNYYWAISTPGDHAEQYKQNGYKAFTGRKGDSPSIFPSEYK